MATQFLLYLSLTVLMSTLFSAYASDPSMLQDFCVGTNDPNKKIFVNGLLCKNPNLVTADDFVFRGVNATLFNYEGLGLSGATVTAARLPGLNTLGISMARLKYEVDGQSPPHFHPRGSEILIILEGTILAGFVSGANKLYSTVLNPGDVFAFPLGLLHFHHNIGETEAGAILLFSSQNGGGGPLANKIFGTQPPIPVEILAKAFQLDPKIIEDLQSKF